jgi:hypothetical protein
MKHSRTWLRAEARRLDVEGERIRAMLAPLRTARPWCGWAIALSVAVMLHEGSRRAARRRGASNEDAFHAARRLAQQIMPFAFPREAPRQRAARLGDSATLIRRRA